MSAKGSDEFKFFDHSLKQLKESGQVSNHVHRTFLSEVEAKDDIANLDWGKIYSEGDMTYPDAIGHTIKMLLEASDEGKLKGQVRSPTERMLTALDDSSPRDKVYKAMFSPFIWTIVIKALKVILGDVTCALIKKYRSRVESVLRHFNVTFRELCKHLHCDCE